MLHFYIDTLEMDGWGYVDTCTTFKEGGKIQFYHYLSIFDTGQHWPTDNFDGGKFGPH